MDPAPAATNRLPLLGVMLLAVVGLAALMLGVAGDRSGLHLLADTDARLEVLPDPAGHLAFPAVLGATGWSDFRSRGYIHAAPRGAVWVRITLHNPTAEPQRAVLADADFINDLLELHTPDPLAPGGWRHARTGQIVPGREKPLWGREAAFFVDLPPRATLTCYLRATDHFATWLHLQWWPEARTFLAAQLRGTMADTIYFGILAALFIYNGVLWARLRHRDLGFYLGYLAGIAVFMTFARSMDQVLGHPLPSPAIEAIHSCALALSGWFLVQFGREFLSLPQTAPRLDRVVRALGWLNLALALGALSLLWSRVTDWIHYVIVGEILIHTTLLFSAIVAWRAGLAHARYFLLSFGLFVAGALPFVAQWMLAIPFGVDALGLLLGSALEMLFLSLALSQRFARLQQERHAAQLAEQRARLETLRYQLNPHFLFNALNSIYGLVLPHSATAGDLVRRLSDFCRSTLTRPGGSWQSLGQELAMLRNYLDIEQARWRDQLVLALEFDPAADDFLLPPFLLLPLVDNAIKHGGATSPALLTVRLATRRDPDGGVTLTLVNSGRWAPAAVPRPSSTSVGLANIRERLAHAFGPAATLTTAADAGWVTLTLRLPPRA